MIDGTNVVRLDPDTQRHVRARIARLPAVVHAFQCAGQKALAELLVEYFESTDDALFEMADNALNNQEQNMFFDSMREFRVQRKSIENRFFETIEEAVARLAGDDNRDHLRGDGELSADALSLVQNEDLEQLVAIEDMVDRANKQFSADLYAISQALSSAVSANISVKVNPFGPNVIALAAMGQFKRLDVDVKAKLTLFKLFDKMVLQQIPCLFQPIYSAFAAHGVNIQVQTVPKDVTEHVGRGEDTETSIDELLGLLSLVQKLPPSSEAFKNASIEQLLDGVQKRRGHTLQLGCIELETIHLVQMLFQFILDDSDLDSQMKDLFCRMQVPVVKVALLDETFLTRKRHPARLLINELASVALQCSHNSFQSVDSSDPMFVIMKRTVDHIIFHFEKNIDIFTEALADFTAFVEKESKRVAIQEKRTIDAESGNVKTEQARMMVAAEVKSKTEDFPLPATVEALIKGPWSNVLFVAGLKYGFSSDEWRAHLKVMNDLIKSVQPCQSKSARQNLMAFIPSVLSRLRLGLDSISYNPFEVLELFKELDEIHLTRMRGELLPGEILLNDTIDLGSSNTLDGCGDLNAEDELEQLEENDPNMIAVEAFSQGAWFGFRSEDLMEQDLQVLEKNEVEAPSNGLVRCRLAAIIKQADKYIFVNRSGMKVTEKTQQQLALSLKNGHLRHLDSSMLFDKALENVVTGLRKSTSPLSGLNNKNS